MINNIVSIVININIINFVVNIDELLWNIMVRIFSSVSIVS